jgi:hypothetical protein
VAEKPFMTDVYDRRKRQDLKNNPYSAKLLLDPANIDEFEQALKMMDER